jgi:hypothetical protein
MRLSQSRTVSQNETFLARGSYRWGMLVMGGLGSEVHGETRCTLYGIVKSNHVLGSARSAVLGEGIWVWGLGV